MPNEIVPSRRASLRWWIALLLILSMYTTMLVQAFGPPREAELFARLRAAGARYPVTAKARPLTVDELHNLQLRHEVTEMMMTNCELIDALRHLPDGTTAKKRGYERTKTGIRWRRP